MDLDARADLDADPDAVFAALADLTTYPHWLAIVAAATPATPATPGPPAAPAAWEIELAGRVGPFTKTKRVRMVRSGFDAGARTVRFERQELDGRVHNPWILTGEATAAATIHVHLHYGGGTVPGAERLLRRDVERAGRRLQAFLDKLE